jgi:hypothetical protein
MMMTGCPVVERERHSSVEWSIAVSIERKGLRLGRPIAVLLLALAAAGCAVQSSSLMGIGSGRSMSDPKTSVFAPAPKPEKPDPFSPQMLKPQPASARAGDGIIVQVQDGDTISDIASRHKVSITTIMSENRLKDPNIFPGMQLRIPKR